MNNIFRYDTVEEAKSAIMKSVLANNWKEQLCKNKDGDDIQYYFEPKSVSRMASIMPMGIFKSQDECDNLLRNCILDNVDAIAKFVAGKGPLKSITTEYDNTVGSVVQYQDGFKISEVKCNTLNMVVCRNDKITAGFYVSDFTPVL